MIEKFNKYNPVIDSNAYVSEKAAVIGQVRLKKNTSIWPQAVLRGDIEKIIIDENSNIQDGVLIHSDFDLPTIVGKNVTVGHGVILHGCRISDYCLIGMGAILLDGCEVKEYTIVAAGALVPEGKKLESQGLYMGIPVKRVRDITPQEKDRIKKSAVEYIKLAAEYLKNQGRKFNF